MRKLVFALLVFQTAILFGQELPNVVPSSPNVSSFEKYLESPVNLATGIPSIQIPLYTIQEGDISVPISLSYHAGGVKVSDVATWVGLGWSLNAGGMVSRVVRGLPDDSSSGLMNTTETIEIVSNYAMDGQDLEDALTAGVSGSLDFESDQYMFNFPGYSGTFLYNQKEEIFQELPYSNIKITPIHDASTDLIIAWQFITPDGMQYYFGYNANETVSAIEENQTNLTHTVDYSGSETINHSFTPNHNVAWYLMEIVSPTGRSIEFFYAEQSNTGDGIPEPTFSRTGDTQIVESCPDDSHPSYSLVSTFQNEMNIDSIAFSNGAVTFDLKGTTRLDRNTKALDQVQILSGASLIKKFKFNYSFIQSSVETGPLVTFGNAAKRRYRMYLDEITQIGSDNSSELPPYQFEYISPNSMPSRFSNAQDHWGYFNGKTTNTTLIPKIKTTSSNIGYAEAIYGSAERYVDTIYAQVGTLNKITYPTGGIKEFIYESNTASSVLSPAALSSGYQNLLTSNLAYNLRNKLANGTTITFNKSSTTPDPPPNNYNYSKTFTIPDNTIGDATITSNITGCSGFGNCDYEITIKGISNSLFTYLIGNSTPNQTFTTSLPPGEYKIEAVMQNLGSTDFNISISTMVDPNAGYTQNSGIPTFYTIGGLRIKQIITRDANQDLVQEKNYSYLNFGESTSSGQLLYPPLYYDNTYYNGSCDPTKNVIKLSSNSVTKLYSIKGSHLTYGNVTELIGNEIKTEHSFSDGHSLSPLLTSFGEIYIPIFELPWRNGKLIKSEHFKKLSNNSFEKVSKTQNSYSSFNTNEFSHFGIKIIQTISGAAFPTFKYGYYSNLSEYYRLASTIQTNYFASDSIVQSQHYYYDNNPLLASETSSSSSDGVNIITKTFYPDDVATLSDLGLENLTGSERDAIIKLNGDNLHQIAKPIQINMYKDRDQDDIADSNELISSLRTNFSEPFTDIILPNDIQTVKGVYHSSTNKFIDQIDYHSYYANGNVKEVSKKNGTHIVYIYGYDEQYPIAKIENATYAEVSAQVSNLHTKSDQDTDNCTSPSCKEEILRVALDALRASVPDAMVTTYTYDPLIGVTSVTDPRGDTVYYQYDVFNRLKTVKDQDGNILNQTEYNYKAQ